MTAKSDESGREEFGRGDGVITRLKEWAERREDVRAAILTSSRTNPHARLDVFSDYDIVYFVRDIRPYLENEAWLEDFGRVLVLYRDPLKARYGFDGFARITQYEDALKIDFTILQAESLGVIAQLEKLPADFEIGYQVLVDKDGLAAGLDAPGYRAYIPDKPTEAAYLTVVEEFFHEATYAAKCLWRGDLAAAKYFIDTSMRFDTLFQMLTWRVEIDHDWQLKPGVLGKGLQKQLPAELWQQLAATYCGLGREENWQALFRMIELFRVVGQVVAGHLGYRYPSDLNERVTEYLRDVHALPQDAAQFVRRNRP